MQAYFLKAMAERRENPGDDIVSDLIQASMQTEGGERPLEEPEIYSIVQQIFTAGQEATAHALTYALAQLLSHPDQLEAVMTDEALIANMVEETVRHLSPSHNMWRIVKQDTVLGGVALKEGDLETFGRITEQEALQLHALMMTSEPSYILMEGGSIELIKRVRAWREKTGHQLYFSLDAGPNLHLLYPDNIKEAVTAFIKAELLEFCEDGHYLQDQVGPGPVRL